MACSANANPENYSSLLVVLFGLLREFSWIAAAIPPLLTCSIPLLRKQIAVPTLLS